MNKKRRNIRDNNDEIIRKIYKRSENVRIKKDAYRPVRTGWLLVSFVFLFIVILLSFANTQILNAGKLKEIAVNQQLTKKSILAKRGNILDRNGEVLAQSIEVDTVTANPKLLKNKKGEGINKEELAETASKIFDVNKQELLNDLNSEKSVVTIAKKQEKEKIEQLKKYLEEKNIVQGINIDKDTKRFYPYNDVASNVIGFLGTDNVGLEGIEKKLDSVLKYGICDIGGRPSRPYNISLFALSLACILLLSSQPIPCDALYDSLQSSPLPVSNILVYGNTLPEVDCNDTSAV